MPTRVLPHVISSMSGPLDTWGTNILLLRGCLSQCTGLLPRGASPSHSAFKTRQRLLALVRTPMAARTRRRRGASDREETVSAPEAAEVAPQEAASPVPSDSPSGGSQAPGPGAGEADGRPRRTRRQARPLLDSVDPDEALGDESEQEAPRAFKPADVPEAPGKRRTRNRTYDEFGKSRNQTQSNGSG
jgi:hypothetical protein